MVEFDLLVHVPTRSAAPTAVWACACSIATPERSRAANLETMVASVLCVSERMWATWKRREKASVRVWVCMCVVTEDGGWVSRGGRSVVSCAC